MEKQSRLLFALAAVLLALVAIIVLAEAPEPGDREEEEGGEQWSALVPDLEADQVTRFELARDGETLVFVREAEGWALAAPVQGPADQVRVEALLDSFLTAEAGEPLEGDRGTFGLTSPRATLRLSAGERTVELAVGNDAPVGWHTYVAVGPDGPARASRTRLSASVQTSLVELRERRLWRLPRTAVDRLVLSSPEAALELQRRGDDWWVRASLAAPGAESAPVPEGEARRADPVRVQALLASLAELQADGFVEAPSFNEEALPWRLEVGAAGVDYRLSAGQTAEGVWVATGPLQPGLVTLAPQWQEPLLRPVPEWWATDLVAVDPLDLAELELVLGERRLVATASEAGWSPAEAERVVDAVQAVRIDRADQPEPVGPPWGHLRLVPRDGSARQLSFHQALDGGDRVVVDDAGGAPFVITALELGRLESALPGEGG